MPTSVSASRERLPLPTAHAIRSQTYQRCVHASLHLRILTADSNWKRIPGQRPDLERAGPQNLSRRDRDAVRRPRPQRGVEGCPTLVEIRLHMPNLHLHVDLTLRPRQRRGSPVSRGPPLRADGGHHPARRRTRAGPGLVVIAQWISSGVPTSGRGWPGAETVVATEIGRSRMTGGPERQRIPAVSVQPSQPSRASFASTSA